MKSIRIRQLHQLRSLMNQIFKRRENSFPQKDCIRTSFKSYFYYEDFWVGLFESLFVLKGLRKLF